MALSEDNSNCLIVNDIQSHRVAAPTTIPLTFPSLENQAGIRKLKNNWELPGLNPLKGFETEINCPQSIVTVVGWFAYYLDPAKQQFANLTRGF